jgi:hypothetical protein
MDRRLEFAQAIRIVFEDDDRSTLHITLSIASAEIHPITDLLMTD